VHRGSARRASAALPRTLSRLPAGRRLRGLSRSVPRQARLSRGVLGARAARLLRDRAQGRNARAGATGAGLGSASSIASSARFEGERPTNEDASGNDEPGRCWDRFRQWLIGIEGDLLPKGPMAIAVRYVLSNWR